MGLVKQSIWFPTGRPDQPGHMKAAYLVLPVRKSFPEEFVANPQTDLIMLSGGILLEMHTPHSRYLRYFAFLPKSRSFLNIYIVTWTSSTKVRLVSASQPWTEPHSIINVCFYTDSGCQNEAKLCLEGIGYIWNRHCWATLQTKKKRDWDVSHVRQTDFCCLNGQKKLQSGPLDFTLWLYSQISGYVS